MEPGGTCSACHSRPATRIFTASVRTDGPIEEAPVCGECYQVLILAFAREELAADQALAKQSGPP